MPTQFFSEPRLVITSDFNLGDNLFIFDYCAIWKLFFHLLLTTAGPSDRHLDRNLAAKWTDHFFKFVK